MGAPRVDYEKHAPEHSFIHVDDFASAKELAEYLHLLNQNDTLYNQYFEWKETGRFINTYFFCRLCAMLHEAPKVQPRHYPDFNEWWRGGFNCIRGSWRHFGQQRQELHRKQLEQQQSLYQQAQHQQAQRQQAQRQQLQHQQSQQVQHQRAIKKKKKKKKLFAQWYSSATPPSPSS